MVGWGGDRHLCLRPTGLKAPDFQTWGRRGEQRPKILRDKTWETGSQVLRLASAVLRGGGLTPRSEGEEGLGAWTPGLRRRG